jgi:hypothetical protein
MPQPSNLPVAPEAPALLRLHDDDVAAIWKRGVTL